MTQDGKARLEGFLNEVHRELQGLSVSEKREVTEELRSHVLDRTAGTLSTDSVDTALQALGSARDVARLNSALRTARTAEAARSPLGILRAAVMLAGASTRALWVIAVSVLGYAVAFGALTLAVIKPFRPTDVRLWHVLDPADPRNYSIGLLSHHAGAHEMLGWWIIPISIGIAVAAGYSTWRYGVTNVRQISRTLKQRAMSDDSQQQ